MQSASAIGRIVAWEQVDGSNQVYLLRNIRQLAALPDISGWVDCTDNKQFLAELADSLEALGIKSMLRWAGVGLTVAGVCHGIAWECPG